MVTLYERFVKALGGLPERARCEAIHSERVQFPRYIREKITLIAGERMIPLYLLLPHTNQPCPAILAHHQHNGEYHLGKSEPVGIAGNPDMHYAHHLAERGYVVAAWDAIGFEERNNAFFGRSHEQFLATKALIKGTCLQRDYIVDTMTVTDYLLTRAEVDGERLGTIGHSLGGQNVLFTLLADHRVTVGVSSCGIGTLRSFVENSVQHNIAWYVPGILELGDTPGLAPLLAGKSLFVSQGERDAIFPMRGVQAFIDAASQYAEVESRLFDGGHSFPIESQQAADRFLDKRFIGSVKATI